MKRVRGILVDVCLVIDDLCSKLEEIGFLKERIILLMDYF